MHRYRAVVLALALVVVPSSLSAQAQFAVSAFGGVYLPAADLLEGTFAIDGGVRLKYGQKTSAVLGGRAAVWPTDRIGIEAEFAYLPSKVEGTWVGGDLVPQTGEDDASVFLGSLNLMYSLIRPPLEPFSLYVSGGIGYVSRGGDFFDILEDNSDIAGVFGVGFKYGIARSTWLRLDVRDYISSYEEKALSEVATEGGESKMQNDLLIVASVELVFGGS
ncbi:MAG: outer membrane beta-barrel protein [Gemmatimonadota bacterium]|nr:MAG: outer membrane beta-barrel protein [Gemmatimonadota bacterium]